MLLTFILCGFFLTQGSVAQKPTAPNTRKNGNHIARGGKVMILNGKSSDANGVSQNVKSVEILDLDDKSEPFTCDNFPDTIGVRYGVAGIIDNTPVWCGGKDENGDKVSHCEKLNVENEVWEHAADLMDGKLSMGKGNIIVKGKLMVSGGYLDNTGETDTIELVSLDSSSVADFSLPIPLYGHCNIKVERGTYLITGGRSNSKHRIETHYQNFINGTWWDGPSMNVDRRYHACTKFELNGINYALVLGGDSSTTSVEYLNLDEPESTWVVANITNEIASGPYMLTHRNEVYLFGGKKGSDKDSTDEIFKLECTDNIENCEFIPYGNMQYPRRHHSIFPISDSIVAKFCPNEP